MAKALPIELSKKNRETHASQSYYNNSLKSTQKKLDPCSSIYPLTLIHVQLSSWEEPLINKSSQPTTQTNKNIAQYYKELEHL